MEKRAKSLEDLLNERDVPQNVIEDMKKEKLDEVTICLMSEEQLKRFLPSEGDRLFVKNYCEHAVSTGSESSPNIKKEKLMDKLRKKLGMKRERQEFSDEDGLPCSKLTGNKNAAKKERRIQIGWLHRESEKHNYKQVRVQSGGGTRQTHVSKESTRSSIVEEGISLFFPKGKSSKGKVTEFEIELLDLSKQEVNHDVTVEQLYEQFKIPLLRFYIATTSSNASKACDNIELSSDTDDFFDPFDDTFFDVGSEVTVASCDSNDTSPAIGIPSNSGTPSVLFNIDPVAEVNLDETIPLCETVQLIEPKFQKVLIRRSNVLEDFISLFADKDVMDTILEVRMVQTNGKIEEGEGHGVVRDALTEFWSAFSRYSNGHEYQVPIIRHDFGKEKWEIIGRILRKGWNDTGYFPIMLAPVFMEQCLYGDNRDGDILESFMMYVSDFERETLKSALDSFPEDLDEILDILDGYNSKVIPSATNLGRVLREIAHKELIQKPMFVIDCWRPVIAPMGQTLDRERFKALYKELVPTVKRVTGMLSAPGELASADNVVLGYLKKYIRSLSARNLKLFVRFCTGADILICPKLYVAFNQIEGFTRSPIAHTCTTTLELPSTYENFNEFRNEFDGILSSNVWVMDIK